MDSDRFDASWDDWFTNRIRQHFTYILDGGWQTASFASRFELTQHLPLKERVDFLLQHYPGPFANYVATLWNAVLDCLQGPKYDIPDEALKFRRAEDERIQQAGQIASQAWTDFQNTIQPNLIQAFPAVNPVHDDRSRIMGKYVVFPAIRNSDWLEEGDRQFFAFGSEKDGFYFANAEAPNAQAMLLAVERFRKLVTPSVEASYVIVGRVLDSASIHVVGEHAYYGIDVDIAAAIVADSMFIDLTHGGPAPRFAGEDIFDMPMHVLPSNDASPTQVMEAFVGSLKTGDLKLWKTLFSDWSVSYLDDGRPLINPHDIRIQEDYFDDSRRALLTNVFDARVAWVDESDVITRGDEFPKAPRVEEVSLELDIIGQFDGEYRRFSNQSVTRFWKLQRVDNGPWRISSVQPF